MERKISLIIPVLDEVEHLGKLVSRIKTTSLGVDYEIIISGAAGNLPELVSRANVRWVDPPKNKEGRVSKMNYAADKAQGDILVFLRPESMPPTGFLQKILWEVNNGVDAGCFRLKYDTRDWLLKANAWVACFDTGSLRFGHQGLFVTQSWFAEIKGYPEEDELMADQEIARRLKSSGAYFKILSDYITVSDSRTKKDVPNSWLDFTEAWLNIREREVAKTQASLGAADNLQSTKANETAHRVRHIHSAPGAGRGENSMG